MLNASERDRGRRTDVTLQALAHQPWSTQVLLQVLESCYDFPESLVCQACHVDTEAASQSEILNSLFTLALQQAGLGQSS